MSSSCMTLTWQTSNQLWHVPQCVWSEIAQQRKKMKGFSTVEKQMRNTLWVLAWLLADQSTGLSQCLTGSRQSVLSGKKESRAMWAALFTRTEQKGEYGEEWGGVKEMGRRGTRMKGRVRKQKDGAQEQETREKAKRGESEGVTFKYLNKMGNQDPRGHHCARQLRTEFKVCRI